MTNRIIDDYCTYKDTSDPAHLKDTIREIDYHFRNETALYMCTSSCPCPSDTDFSKWNEDDFRDYNRTKDSSTQAAAKIK
jgi:hypothetical protein